MWMSLNSYLKTLDADVAVEWKNGAVTRLPVVAYSRLNCRILRVFYSA
jgi:hypothetical protein